jgi:hypothetical protein
MAVALRPDIRSSFSGDDRLFGAVYLLVCPVSEPAERRYGIRASFPPGVISFERLASHRWRLRRYFNLHAVFAVQRSVSMTDPKSRLPREARVASRRMPLGVILGTIASVATIAAFGFFVFDRLNAATPIPATPRPRESTSPSAPIATPPTLEPLLAIHTGNPVEKVIEAAGSSIASHAIPGAPEWVEQLFVHGNYAATVLVSPTKKITLYSVLVCDRSLAPTFTTPSKTTVTLMAKPISQAESSKTGDRDQNDRPLFYLDGGTGNSLGQLIEVSVDQPRSGNGNRGYLIGINRACGDTAFRGLATAENREYRGNIREAPADLNAFRERTPANFYAEVAGDFTINQDGTVDLRPVDSGDTVVGVLASPFIHDLPVEFLSQAGAG